MGELFGAHIQHRQFGVAFFDFQPDGVRKVRFTQSRGSVNQQRVERRTSWLVGYREACRSCKSIAFPFDELPEIVIGVQVGVDVQFAQTRNDKRVLDRRVVDASRQWDSRVLCRLPIGHGHLHRIRARLAIACCSRILHDNAVFKTRVRAEFFVNGLAQELDVMLL